MVVVTSPGAEVRSLTREDMLSERAAQLAEAGMSEATLRRRGAEYDLDAHHRGLLARIESLDFLLNHTPA
jgi:hypothetical protein